MSKAAIYQIMKKVKAGKDTTDHRRQNPKKNKKTAALVVAVAATIKEDRRACVGDLAVAHGVSVDTMHSILHEDLGLSKKSARWDNAPVHTAAVVRDFLAPRGSSMRSICLIWLQQTFSYYPKVKDMLAGTSITQETLKKTWDGVLIMVSENEFAIAFRGWIERQEKCICIGGGYVEKS